MKEMQGINELPEYETLKKQFIDRMCTTLKIVMEFAVKSVPKAQMNDVLNAINKLNPTAEIEYLEGFLDDDFESSSTLIFALVLDYIAQLMTVIMMICKDKKRVKEHYVAFGEMKKVMDAMNAEVAQMKAMKQKQTELMVIKKPMSTMPNYMVIDQPVTRSNVQAFHTFIKKYDPSYYSFFLSCPVTDDDVGFLMQRHPEA